MATTGTFAILLAGLLVASFGMFGAGQLMTERLVVDESLTIEANYGLGSVSQRPVRLEVSLETTNPVDLLVLVWLADRPRPVDLDQITVFRSEATTAEDFYFGVPAGMFWFIDMKRLVEGPNPAYLTIREVDEASKTAFLLGGIGLGAGAALVAIGLLQIGNVVKGLSATGPDTEFSQARADLGPTPKGRR